MSETADTQRMEKIGGRCTVLSRPGGGTEIKFTLNVEVEAQKVL